MSEIGRWLRLPLRCPFAPAAMTLFRSAPNRIYYGDNRSAAAYDEYAVAVGVAAGILGLAWLCVWPTCKRKRQTALVNAAYCFCIYVFVVAIRQSCIHTRSSDRSPGRTVSGCSQVN